MRSLLAEMAATPRKQPDGGSRVAELHQAGLSVREIALALELPEPVVWAALLAWMQGVG